MHSFRKAMVADAQAIAQLVNSAYRGEASRAGWTTEADILDGLRTNADEVKRLIESDGVMILLCMNLGDLIGAVCLEKMRNIVNIGMFVVNPMLQNQGIGKALLVTAENLAQQMWEVDKFQMHVITVRHELLAFYLRRGYQRTGFVSEFPVNPAVWQPKLTGLQLVVLEKIIR